MTDESEKTIPPAERYRRAEMAFDRAWSAIGASPWTLAAFVIWTVLMVLAGMWIGAKP